MVQIGQVLIHHDSIWDDGANEPQAVNRRAVVIANRGEKHDAYVAEETAKHEAAGRTSTLFLSQTRLEDYHIWDVLMIDVVEHSHLRDRDYYVSNEAPKPNHYYRADWHRRWTVTDEILAPDEIEKVKAARKARIKAREDAEAARQEALRQSYECDYDGLVAKLRAENPWATSDSAMDNLKTELKRKYPEVKFKWPTKNNYQIQWYLGPEREEVQALVRKYENPHGEAATSGEDCNANHDGIIYMESPFGRAHKDVFGRFAGWRGGPNFWRLDTEMVHEEIAELKRCYQQFIAGRETYHKGMKAGLEKRLRYCEKLLAQRGEVAQ